MKYLNLNTADTYICRCCDRKLWELGKLYLFSDSRTNFRKYTTNFPKSFLKEHIQLLQLCMNGTLYSRYEIMMYADLNGASISDIDQLFDKNSLSLLELICDT